MQEASTDGTCRYRQSCHFYNLGGKNNANLRLRDLFCVKWPEQRKIHQTRRTAAPVSITMWPTGRV